jgi:hypothetical protein
MKLSLYDTVATSSPTQLYCHRRLIQEIAHVDSQLDLQGHLGYGGSTPGRELLLGAELVRRWRTAQVREAGGSHAEQHLLVLR